MTPLMGFTRPRTEFCARTRSWYTSWKGLDRVTKEFTHEYVVIQTSPPGLLVEADDRRWRERA